MRSGKLTIAQDAGTFGFPGILQGEAGLVSAQTGVVCAVPERRMGGPCAVGTIH